MRQVRVLAVAVAAAAAALAGCAPQQMRFDDPPPPSATAEKAAAERPAAANPTPPRPRPRPGSGAAKPAAQPTQPPSEAARVPALQGMTEAETIMLLGQPVQQLDAPPGKIWHYATIDCALEIFFFLDVASNRFQVLQYRAVGEPAEGQASELCLQRIRHDHHGRESAQR